MTYLQHIKDILRETIKPLSAAEISNELTSKGIYRSRNNYAEITPNQIRDRIRKDESGSIEILGTNPFKYRLKESTNNLWVLKTVHEEDKASKTIDNYNDSPSEYYNYDSLVANSKQISSGDLAILIDKEKVLGFAHIGHIGTFTGQKTIRRCPECPSTTIDRRTRKLPIYRCNKGHEFDTPVEELKTVKKFNAIFDHFIVFNGSNDTLKQLRPFYIKGYNQNMSMQLLDMKALGLFPDIESILLGNSHSLDNTIISPNEGLSKEDEAEYQHTETDDRENVLRGIRARRGQQKFREDLCKRYNSTCVITGCKILDILEAAHIMPHRGKKDNHPSNGLLLRADIHTLYDLNLIAIDPKNLHVHFHRKVLKEYGEFHLNKILVESHNQPNAKCLTWRWNIYTTTL